MDSEAGWRPGGCISYPGFRTLTGGRDDVQPISKLGIKGTSVAGDLPAVDNGYYDYRRIMTIDRLPGFVRIQCPHCQKGRSGTFMRRLGLVGTTPPTRHRLESFWAAAFSWFRGAVLKRHACSTVTGRARKSGDSITTHLDPLNSRLVDVRQLVDAISIPIKRAIQTVGG